MKSIEKIFQTLNCEVDEVPVGIVEAKKDDAGENLTAVEGQSSRYANSTFQWVKGIIGADLPMKQPAN